MRGLAERQKLGRLQVACCVACLRWAFRCFQTENHHVTKITPNHQPMTYTLPATDEKMQCGSKEATKAWNHSCMKGLKGRSAPFPVGNMAQG